MQNNSFNYDIKASKILEEILNEIGLSKNFVLKPCDNINNAVATSYRGIRYILYDRTFMKSITEGNNWANLFIFAHEVGHHVNGHSLDIVLYASEVVESKTLETSRKQEIEADEFAGFVLAKLGCPIIEINKLIEKISSPKDDTYSTHPNRYKRLKAVQIGYNKAKKTSGNTWELGSFKKEELPLSQMQIKQRFPNDIGGYFDENGDLLFNGSDFDINHPDSERIATYILNNFTGSYFSSLCYTIRYKADKYGNILNTEYHTIQDEKGKLIVELTFKEKGTIEMQYYK